MKAQTSFIVLIKARWIAVRQLHETSVWTMLHLFFVPNVQNQLLGGIDTIKKKTRISEWSVPLVDITYILCHWLSFTTKVHRHMCWSVWFYTGTLIIFNEKDQREGHIDWHTSKCPFLAKNNSLDVGRTLLIKQTQGTPPYYAYIMTMNILPLPLHSFLYVTTFYKL